MGIASDGPIGSQNKNDIEFNQFFLNHTSNSRQPQLEANVVTNFSPSVEVERNKSSPFAHSLNSPMRSYSQKQTITSADYDFFNPAVVEGEFGKNDNIAKFDFTPSFIMMNQHQSQNYQPDSSSFTQIDEMSNGDCMRSKKYTKKVPHEQKDQIYWERRRKNNEAAKRSRELKRTRENQMRYNSLCLQMENQCLMREVARLREQISFLKKGGKVLASNMAPNINSQANMF
ncbi:MAG: hypothetical protein MHPSP_002194 [Paramarteilia canceri]